jgi:hypothetical protein
MINQEHLSRKEFLQLPRVPPPARTIVRAPSAREGKRHPPTVNDAARQGQAMHYREARSPCSFSVRLVQG